MKRLIIASAIVCVAVFSHAAQYSWSATDICTGFGAGGANDNNAGGMAYLFLNSGNTTLGAIQDAVVAGTFVSKFSSLALDSAVFTDGAVASTTAEKVAGVTGDSLFTVFVADSWTEFQGPGSGKVDPAQAFVSAALTPGMVEPYGTTILDFESFYKNGTYGDTTDAGSWAAQSTSDVPEPTSGLLLLLGVAGLGLKRRRV